ncbi:MAG TPA: hypothetical protein VM841_02825 [Actinomycetota bacterium]|nr:hypothetical protein [Actinomycetota bacterium]
MPDAQDKRNKEYDQAAEAATVLDPRLADLWAAIWSSHDEAIPLGMAAALLRLAYLTGYQDALTEADRGSLFTALGLPVPARVKPPGAARRPSR